jgi:hypothetical protein
MIIPVQRRLLNFFNAVRNESPQLEWTFLLIVEDSQSWTESMLATKGMPTSWVVWINATASFPFKGRFATGCLTAHRVVRPKKAARHILAESKSLVADVLAEFAGRMPDYR